MAVSTGAAILGSAAIGALAGGKGSKQSGTTQTVQTNEPWAVQQPYLDDLYNTSKWTYWDQFRKPAGETTEALNLTAQRARAGSPLNAAAQAQNLATLRGDYLDLSKNPAAQSAMGMARSQINSQFGGDNFGNSAHQEWLSRGLLNAAAPFYESERQRQTGATALAPTLAAQDYTDLAQLQNVGTTRQNLPWDLISKYQASLGGTQGGTSTTQQPYFTNPMANALGGAVGGLSLYNGMNQAGLLGSAGTSGMPQEMVAGQYSLINPQYG